MVRLNVLSLLHLTKYMVKDMVGRGRGRILITSSIAGTMANAHTRRFTALPVYGATKAPTRTPKWRVRLWDSLLSPYSATLICSAAFPAVKRNTFGSRMAM